MGTQKDFVVKKGLVVTEDIELGHATDTTIARASSGVVSIEGNNVIMASNNVSALTDSTSAAIGIGTIELGHASDTTIARASAGAITVEGTAVLLGGAQTGITTDFNTGRKVGRDAHNHIDFSTDNEIHFKTNNETPVIKMKASGEIEATSLDISGDVDVDGTLETDNLTVGGQQGTNGQVLTSTGSGVQWDDAGGGASTLNDLTDVISNTTNFTDSILISPDGAAPPQGGTLSSATNNVGIGKDVFGDAMTSGHSNVALGTEAGKAVTSMHEAVLIGHHAGKGLTYGSDNVAIGAYTLDAASSASANVAVGWSALSGITGGGSNVAIGYGAGQTVSNNTNNVFVGRGAGNSLNSSNNVIVGYLAGDGISNGGNNTLIGYQAGGGMSGNADSNICLGYNAGDNITTGDNNLVIGAADVDSATGDDQISISSGDGGVTWIKGDANGIKALKIKVVPINGTTQLTDAQSGSYVYVYGSGVPELPDGAEVGQQYTIVNNKGSTVTVGAGNSNSFIGTATVDDDKAKTFVAVETNLWFAIG
tara:strand:- start:6545 stop:8155 length:1611 start_codon:yes stop_codon:yes gene_type:complete